jgi:hypothetical protein
MQSYGLRHHMASKQGEWQGRAASMGNRDSAFNTQPHPRHSASLATAHHALG